MLTVAPLPPNDVILKVYRMLGADENLRIKYRPGYRARVCTMNSSTGLRPCHAGLAAVIRGKVPALTLDSATIP
jgi:hypothetical protein